MRKLVFIWEHVILCCFVSYLDANVCVHQLHTYVACLQYLWDATCIRSATCMYSVFVVYLYVVLVPMKRVRTKIWFNSDIFIDNTPL